MNQRRFNTKNDPMREMFGAAEISNPKELQMIIDDLNKSGVEITRREKATGYSPAFRAGHPGQFIIEEGAGYSAWCHEYKHFCDDGYLEFRVFQDNEKCKRREIDAYQIEIDFAQKAGREDIAERLIKLRDEEVTKYE